MQKVNLAAALSTFDDYWKPRIAGELNGQHVKLVKFQGEFVWHSHASEDELFLVLRGSFTMEYRDSDGAVCAIQLEPGEFLIIPRGIEHRPVAANEVEVLLFEPAGTLNTGNVICERTVADPERI